MTLIWSSNVWRSYIVTFGELDQQTKPADTHTHTVQQYKQHNDWFYGKERSIQWRLLTSPCCSCLLVCLSVAFEHLNRVTDCYKFDVNIMIKLEGLGRLKFQFQTLSNKNKEDMRNFEVWAILLTLHILCATGTWTNVKKLLSIYSYRMGNSKMGALPMFGWVFYYDKNGWWEIGVCILIRS